MAYRFLLEVPEAMVDDANIAINSVPDAQVLLVRNSHGLGFDDPYSDLTVAAHSLGVIGAIYDWYEQLPNPKPEVGLVLHSGQRVPLTAGARADMVRLVRRDQPWVERTLPKIGDHMRDVLPGGQIGREATEQWIPSSEPQAFVSLVAPTRKLELLGNVQVAVKVPDLDRAERYYVDFLGMHVVGRERKDRTGNYHPVEPGYDHARALSTGTEADVSFLANGQITMALDRVGRGARLQRSAEPPVPIRVPRSTFMEIKGAALVRGMEIDGDGIDVLAVRDIYGLVWEFTVDHSATPAGELSA